MAIRTGQEAHTTGTEAYSADGSEDSWEETTMAGEQASVHESGGGAQPGEFRIGVEIRPHERLMKQYLIIAGFTLIGFPIAALAYYCRYCTLRYRFDLDGVTMRVGVLFKRETSLAYRRIQDIHVTRGIIQRWLGLASVSVQTASGSGGAEMVVEGILDYEKVRDFLYSKMRGARGLEHVQAPAQPAATVAALAGAELGDQALGLLEEIRDLLKEGAGR